MTKRKMKVLAMSMAVALCLTACGGDNSTSSEESTGSEITESTTETDETTKNEMATKFDFEPSIKESVVYDDNGIEITALNLEYENNNAILNLKIQNTSEKELSISSCTLGYSCNSVSGYMMDAGHMSEDIPAGESVETEMSFSTNELLLYGITKVANIDLGFTINDEDYNTIYTEPIRISTSCADKYDYETDTYQNTIESNPIVPAMGANIEGFQVSDIYNEGGIQVISQAILTNKDGEKTLLLELQNDTDEQLYFRVCNVRFNDEVMYEGTWSNESVNAKTRRIMRVSLDQLIEQSASAIQTDEIANIKALVNVSDKNSNDRSMPTDISITLE